MCVDSTGELNEVAILIGLVVRVERNEGLGSDRKQTSLSWVYSTGRSAIARSMAHGRRGAAMEQWMGLFLREASLL